MKSAPLSRWMIKQFNKMFHLEVDPKLLSLNAKTLYLYTIECHNSIINQRTSIKWIEVAFIRIFPKR